MADLPSGTVTFLLTDVEGSTRIWEGNPVEARLAFARHDALVAEHLSAFGAGRPKDQGEGDSAFAVFSRAGDALQCAVALQRALHAEAWPHEAVIRVRMALHTGEAELAQGNYKGSAVHRCARLRSLAHGGQVVVSEATAQIARDGLTDGVTLRDLGVHELRGLVRPERVFQLCDALLPVDFPPLLSVGSRPHDLPTGAEVPLPSGLRVPGDDLFVGRDSALRGLRAVWDQPPSGAVRIALVAGEAGIGKSRLAAQFADAVHRDGATVLFGRCDEEALRPYQAFAEAFGTYLRAVPSDALEYRLGRTGPELGPLLPELRVRIGGPADQPGSDPESLRFRLFEAVAELFAELASGALVLFVVDDLHWADKGTLLMLRHLARHADLGRLMLLATYRDEHVPATSAFGETLVALDREHSVARVPLDGLDTDAVTRIVEGSRGPSTAGDSTDLARTVREQTDGNPFFIREMLRDLDESSGPSGADGAGSSVGVPSSVRGLVTQRVARLPEPAERVLAAASVVGREFTFEVVESVVDVGEDAVLDALESALHASLVREVPARVGSYVFSHAIVRHSLYDGLSAARRAQLHRRVGEAMEALTATRPDPPLAELAYHFGQAVGLGAAAPAVEYATRAGDRATELLAYEDAVRYYQMALDALDLADVAHRVELLCAMGGASWRTGDAEKARATFLTAAELARQLGDVEHFAIAALGFGGSGFWPWWAEHGLVDDVLVTLLEEALDALPVRDSVLRVELLGSLSQQLYLPHDERQARLADESLAMARRLGEPVTLARALCSWRLNRWQFGNVRERLAVSNEALALARELDERELVMQALSVRFVDLMELGDVDAADADVAELARLAEDLHVPYYLWVTTLYAGMRALMQGRFADVEELASEGYKHGERAQRSVAVQFAGAQLAELQRELGHVDRYRAVIGLAADEHSDIVPVWKAVSILANVEAGDRTRARRAFDELAANRFAAVPDDFFRSITLGLLAESCVRLGDVDRAAMLYELLLPHREQLVLLTNSVVFLGSVSYHLGVLALLRGDHEAAEEHLQDARERHARIGAAPFLVRTQLCYARLLAARDAPGDREQLGPLLDEVARDATLLGMQSVRADAEAMRVARSPRK
ncbi:MAG TPA: AAA family ATPase [Acidimicrobiia bacterium]|nr:AAA family ATPase [Acidimicrobiia bacterium]